MIYCVAFGDVVGWLGQLGFREIGRGERFVAFAHEDGRVFSVRPPNTRGDLTEISVNDALATAGLPCPQWDLHWGD